MGETDTSEKNISSSSLHVLVKRSLTMLMTIQVVKLRPVASTPSIPRLSAFFFFSNPLCMLFYFPRSLIIFCKFVKFLLPLHRPPGLTGSPVISDISLIHLSPHAAAGAGDSPFNPPHPYVSPHMEHYLRSVHGSPTLSMISAARGLSPAEGKKSITCFFFVLNFYLFGSDFHIDILQKMMCSLCS